MLFVMILLLRRSESFLMASRCASSRLMCSASPISIYALSDAELTNLVKEWKEKPFRAKQIRQWVKGGTTDFDSMLNLPASLREKLKASISTQSLQIVKEQVSKDGTVKRAYRLPDGNVIESVCMVYNDGRRTACVSSQAGCAMGCVFCATGQMGFKRQLEAYEIFEQVARFDADLKQKGERISNVVMMGMGEPLLNYKHVSAAIGRMKSELGIGSRKITVSTVGVVPAIAKLSQDHPYVNLAISLHAADDKARSKLLPANERYGRLDELMKAARNHWLMTKRRVSFEWALVHGQNDDVETAKKLGMLLRKYQLAGPASHVNVIPLNPTKGYDGGPSKTHAVAVFCSTLRDEFRVEATVRVRRGIDIDAGCGQLATDVTNQLTRERESSTTEGDGDVVAA